jgi:phosphoglycolate phosphatase-like HAD superfamily hydrolase
MITEIKKKNNIYIGDTLHDKESAKLSNSDFIQVIYGFGDPIKNVANFDNFSDLCELRVELFHVIFSAY